MIGLVVVIVIVGSIIGGLIFLNGHTSTNTTVTTGLLGSDISYSLFQNLTAVSFSTLAAIGNGGSGVSPPTWITSSPLVNGTKPEVLYIGAEFCPYCAAERWSLVVALSKFGNFTNLEYMQSAADDGNIATLTFLNANYTSKYLSFVTVENEDRNHNNLQIPTGAEETLWSEFNPSAYPFVDIGGQYDIVTSQFSFGDLSNLNWTQIGSQAEQCIQSDRESNRWGSKYIDRFILQHHQSNALQCLRAEVSQLDNRRLYSTSGWQYISIPAGSRPLALDGVRVASWKTYFLNCLLP